MELARLHQERRDLEAATQIQKSFLPAARPRVPQLHFFDYYASARQIGGDYYDYIPLPSNRLAVALGDVSGKGVAAALWMARLSAAVRFCLASEADAPTAMRRLNVGLTQTGADDRFVTFTAAILDLATYGVTLVNAGHMPPLRRRPGRPGVEEVGDAIVGLPLGVMDRPYEQMTFPLEPGDVLLFYTDGVTEAQPQQRPVRTGSAVQDGRQRPEGRGGAGGGGAGRRAALRGGKAAKRRLDDRVCGTRCVRGEGWASRYWSPSAPPSTAGLAKPRQRGCERSAETPSRACRPRPF